MRPTTRSSSRRNSETRDTSQLADAGRPGTQEEEPSTSSASRCNSDTGRPQSPSQSGLVDSPSQSSPIFEKHPTRSAFRPNSETRRPSQLAVADSSSRSATKHQEVELDGFSLAEEDYMMMDTPGTQVKVEFPTVDNLMEDSRDSVVSIDSCTESFQNRNRTENNIDSSEEKIDPRQSCGSVVQIFNGASCNESRQYNSEWESDVESETLKSEPPSVSYSDREATPSSEQLIPHYQNVKNDFRLHLKQEEIPLRNHEENGISSFIEIIENPPYKAEKLGNDNNSSSEDLNINTRESYFTSDAMKPGDNCEPREHNSEVVSFKSINSPKSDDNFDVRSDSQEYVLANENTCGENDSHSMHRCNPSCEVNGKCVIKAHDRLYGPSFVSLSPKYLNILNSVPEKNDNGDISKNVNLSSISDDNNGWDSDQDKKKCISGISTMSFSENGFTINAINESITLSDSESEAEPREWWNVSHNKSKGKMTPPNPVDCDSDARSTPFKERPAGYCQKCAPPPYLIEDLLGDLSSVFYYFYTDFFCLCKSNSKLYSENSDFFNKMNTVVSILNSVNPKYMVGILAFLIYGRSPDLIKELEFQIKNDSNKKRGRRKKKNKLVLKDEINGSYVLFEKNNQFSLVQGEGTSYERVINLDRVVLGTKRKVRVPPDEANSKENRIINQKVNDVKKRRKVKKVGDKVTYDTSWERVIPLDKDAKATQDKQWLPPEKTNLKDHCEPSARFSTDGIHSNVKQRRVRRKRKTKEGDHKKLKMEASIAMSDDDLSPSTSSFPGFNTIEIPAAENDVDIWKESVNELLEYSSEFKGFTGVARKKSAKKKSIFLDWLEGTSKSKPCIT